MNDQEMKTTKWSRKTTESKARGLRVKQLRNMTGLDRKAFSERYQVSLNTLIAWETGAYAGLSKNALNHLREALIGEGIVYTDEWLISGNGPEPIKVGKIQETVTTTIDQNDARMLDQLHELSKHYENVVSMQVQDDAMLPRFSPGDYVAGISIKEENFAQYIGHDCIIQNEKEGLLLRRLRDSHEHKGFTLTCINPNTTVTNPILNNIQPRMLVPVLWHIIKIS